MQANLREKVFLFMPSKLLLHPEINVKRNAPLNLVPENKFFFEHEFEKSFPPVYLYNLQNTNVSFEAVVFKNMQVFKPSLVYSWQVKDYNLIYLLKNYLKRKKHTLAKSGKYLLACDVWSNGYFHWMCDALPRLTISKNMHSDFTLLLPEGYNAPYIINSLKMFAFKEILLIKKDSYVRVPELALPGHVAPTGNFNPAIMSAIRNNFFELYKDCKFEHGEKIYISRRNANYRHILNEDEVLKVVEANGFKIVALEDYTHEEQISIMKHSRFVIGCIGAGMVNTLFMQKGGSVLEFREKGDGYNNAYFALTSAVGVNFLSQFCECDRSRYSNTAIQNLVKFDLLVDIPELEKNIELMLKPL
ncbi:MAG: glycosyltransferase family 61 protein [Bacteroidia bacterium]|nr:glycosyltransferase family 61 protein [Bacteroidia bacterium]